VNYVECEECGCIYPPLVTRGVCPECDSGVVEPRKMKDLED
jgi:Zn finger protein HypA/HybF involved in hydrogenase expression